VSPGFARRAGQFLLKEFLEILPPTIFFVVGFNLILLTTNLILSDYGEQFSSYLLATVAAFVVGKAILVANAMGSIRHYDRAPLIRPILYKTVFYWAMVFIARLLEHWIKYLAARHPLGTFVPHMVTTFSWNRFIAVQLWIFVLFLIYVTVTELNHLFGEGELWHIIFTSRPAELPLNRRQRIRELVRLSQLADTHSVDEFRDPSSVAHTQLIDIVRRLAAEPRSQRSAQ
jgi:chromate transport protein ChrA